jgi:phage shock protein E
MTKYITIAAIAFLAFILVKKYLTNKAGKSKVNLMKHSGKKMFLVDVRQPDEFLSGSVQGAVNIPLGDIKNRIIEFKNKQNIVVFCRSGNRSGQATSILNQNGILDVTNGGTWQNVSEALK